MILFLREYLRNIRSVGAVMPSSRILAGVMLKKVDFRNARTIVEYGAGTGAISKLILALKHPQTQYILIEQNPYFCEVLLKLTRGIPNVFLIEGDVKSLPKICENYAIDAIDYIISGIPFASLRPRDAYVILDTTAEFLQQGTFVTFQYFRKTERMFRRFFPHVCYERVWRNIPPAYVLTCKK